MMAGQIGYWLLAVGYLHISTFYKKGATHETICTGGYRVRKFPLDARAQIMVSYLPKR